MRKNVHLNSGNSRWIYFLRQVFILYHIIVLLVEQSGITHGVISTAGNAAGQSWSKRSEIIKNHVKSLLSLVLAIGPFLEKRFWAPKLHWPCWLVCGVKLCQVFRLFCCA